MAATSIMTLFRRSELVLLIYFGYASGVSLFLDLPHPVVIATAIVNLTVLTGYFLLAFFERRSPGTALGTIRDWLPIPLMLLCYREMGWFAPAEHTYELERGWVVWDKLLLHHWGLRDAIEAAGPLLPSILEISYALTYTLGAFSMAMLYFYRRRESADRFLFVLLLSALLSYALFPYFPSEPPRTVFPGQDMPRIDTVFRQFNWWLLSRGGIHTSVFPSAHVSSAFGAAFGLLLVMPKPSWVYRTVMTLAICIFWATIYGRYHYAVDAVAGFAVSLVALGAGAALKRREGGAADASDPAGA